MILAGILFLVSLIFVTQINSYPLTFKFLILVSLKIFNYDNLIIQFICIFESILTYLRMHTANVTDNSFFDYV